MPENFMENRDRVMKIAFDPLYAHPLPAGHRFPMLKYELIPEQLLYEGIISPGDLFSPQACDEATILLTHTPEYLSKLLTQNLPPSGKPETPEPPPLW